MIVDKEYTIKDIAEKLQLSKSTVSRALRNSHDVNPETRKRVLMLAEQLNFEPNAIAKNLRQQKTFTIGVVIPSFKIPFYSTAVTGIHKAASLAGYNVIICQNDDSYEGEMQNVNSLIKSRVDGILISFAQGTTNFDHIKKLQEKNFPVVLFNRVNTNLNLPVVMVDDYKSSYDATKYLIGRGNKNIAYISGPENIKLSNDRKRGYIDCLRDHDLRIRESLIVESDFSIQSGEYCAEFLLKLPTKPDAIYCVCDAVAFGVMKTLKRKRIQIPKEISVMGYTNEPVADLVDPPLTTVSQPIAEIGEKAVELLLKVIGKKLTIDENKILTLDTCMVVRRSTI